MIYAYKRKKHFQTIEGRIPDELWDEFKIMIPTKRPNNTSGHPIVPFRKVLDGIILYVLSIPVSVVVITPANTHDMKAAKDTLDSG